MATGESPSLCAVCRKASVYKCPTCRTRYCSVNCCKAHKLLCKSSVVDRDQNVLQIRRTEHVDITTSDVVAGEQLRLLKDSKSLRDMLANVHLRKLLMELEEAGPDPANTEVLVDRLMDIPIFSEFADECLKLINSQASQ